MPFSKIYVFKFWPLDRTWIWEINKQGVLISPRGGEKTRKINKRPGTFIATREYVVQSCPRVPSKLFKIPVILAHAVIEDQSRTTKI